MHVSGNRGNYIPKKSTDAFVIILDIGNNKFEFTPIYQKTIDICCNVPKCHQIFDNGHNIHIARDIFFLDERFKGFECIPMRKWSGWNIDPPIFQDSNHKMLRGIIISQTLIGKG